MSNPNDIPLRISWVVNKRRAHGYLLVDEHALQLICLRDDSETAAVAGKATAGQFGLIGALVSAGVSGARELSRAKELRELYAAQQDLPVTERLKRNPLSRSIARSEITCLQKGPRLSPMLQSATGPIAIEGEGPGAWEAIEAWCGRLQIPTEIVLPKKMNRKLFWGLVLSPVALVVLYAIICVPYAIAHLSATNSGLAKFESFKAIAVPAHAAIPGPLGTSFVEGCAATLKQFPLEQQVSFVGELPPNAKAMIKNNYSNFPQFSSIEPAYSKWSDPRLRSEQLESGWRREGSFGTSYERMFTSPFSWGRALSRTGTPRFDDSKLLLVGKVNQVVFDGSTSGRASIAVRALDFQTGAVKCEGDLTIGFPPGGRDSSVGLDFSMSQALGIGLHLPGCGSSTTGLCKDVAYYAELAQPVEPAPTTVAAAPVKPKPAPAKKKRTRR